MKTMTLTLLLLWAWQSHSESTTDDSKPTYNEALAQELGADDYGMKMYVMAILKAGPNQDQTPEEAAKLQQAHMENIGRMAKSGDLVVAGPFAKNELGFRGIYVFNVKTIEEAKSLTESDPAIQAGRLAMELIPWYSSAALMQVPEVATTLAKKSF